MDINCQILSDENFEYIKKGSIKIENGKIIKVNKEYNRKGINLKHCLAVPGLINAHTHIGDSFALDACCGLNVREAVGRRGRKWQLHQNTPSNLRVKAMRGTAKWMLYSGTTTFVDFREGGINGIKELKKALKNLPIKSIILGRDLTEKELESCDGLGLNIPKLDQIPEKKPKNKFIAVHAGELENEIGEALKAKPDVIVHFTKATEEEIKEAKKQDISVILCPRSNAALKAGFPPAKKLLMDSVNTCLGTDNVMINQPDMWREMEFLYKYSQIKDPLTPKQVLSTATTNPAKAFKLNTGTIKENKDADIVFINMKAPNLRYSRDIIATIVNRVYPQNIEKVMVLGKFIK